ncbi:hypothetical protein QFC21_001261 [Naganishia friedmannii]|uniref:Uncharacterized protein n=1 Tax=Naganishia friedmannii TaxID=89922 RepID=A0ACC2W317_9TREE|nr:hypothetical protein QFC21_001261 [Naganishia friedmannii]
MQLATHFVCSFDKAEGESDTEPIQIKQLAWRQDSQYLLACAPQIGVVWVFAIASATRERRAVLKAGIEGFVRCEWSGTGTEVLCFSGNGNFKSTPGYRQYFALVERHHNKEHLCVYDAGDRYNLVRVRRPLLGKFTPSSTSFSGADPGLGIRTVTWGPGGNWIAIGGWDGKLRIIESDGWRCISTVDPSTRPPTRATAVWRQPSDWLQQSKGTHPVPFSSAPMFHEWPRRKATPLKSNPGLGISQIEWNVDGSCFAVRSDTIPNVVQIYSFLSDATSLPTAVNLITAIIFKHPLRQMRWNPQRAKKLAMCTLADDFAQSNMDSGIFMWDGEWEEEDSFTGPDETKQGVVEATVIPFDRDQFCVLHDTEGFTSDAMPGSTELSLIQE